MITFSENSLTIKEISAFEIDYQDGGMVIKFSGGFLFLGNGEIDKEEKKPSPVQVEIEKAVIPSFIPHPAPSPISVTPPASPHPAAPPPDNYPWSFLELKEKILEYGRGKGGEFAFPISSGQHIKDAATNKLREEILTLFGGTNYTKILLYALRELISEKKLFRGKTDADEPSVYQIVEEGKPLRPILSRSEKKLIAAKEKILEYGRARGGKFEFLFRVGVRSSEESIEKARALRAEHFPEIGITVISEALNSLLAEGKLKKYQPVQSKPAIYEIKENSGNNGGNGGNSSKDVNGRCKRCNGQLQILSTRTEGYEGEEFEYKHCVMCGQDYYPERSEVK